MLQPGARFDRYVIEGVLGEGGMGRVYLALDSRLGRRVALKVLLAGPDGLGHAEAAARMMREGRAAAAFNHPNVVAIYDVGEHAGSPYIAMELVSGRTLRAAIGRDIPLAQRVTWLLDVARGLGAAHRAGLVHRDMKPDNVMITTDGGVKILDFGIAKASHVEADAHAATVTPDLPSLTAAGVAIGTPQYMPPEQLRSEPLDGRADQFAWGVLAYELLTGRYPWSSASGAHLVAALLSVHLPPLNQVRPDIDPRLSSAVARALEKDRESRFATMDDLIASIEGAAARSPAAVSYPPPNSNEELATAKTTQAPAEARGAVATDRAKRPGAGRLWIGGAVLGALAAALFAVLARQPARMTDTSTTAVDAGPTATVTHASPTPATPAAAAAYASALQELHDAKLSAMMPTLGEVVKDDPAFAPAYVRRAGVYLLMDDYAGARDAFGKAWDLRATLGEVDGATLEAMEPATREPPMTSEYTARIARVSETHPKELFPAILAAGALTDAEQLERAATFYDRAIAADPTAALAYFGKGELAVRSGDLDAGGRLFDDCTRASPTNLECRSGLFLVFADKGRCEEAKGVARQILATVSEPGFHEDLAAAAALTGEPIGVIGEYLQRANEHTVPEIADSETAMHGEQLAILAGDFRRAEDFTLKWDAALKAESRESLDALLERFAIAAEANELPSHRAEILAAWTRSVAWLEPVDEARLRLAHREHQVGLITSSELEQRRQAWRKAKIEEAARIGAPIAEEMLWRKMYVLDAGTEEEARAALFYYADAGAPKLSLENSAPQDQLAFGVAYARVGSYAKAIPLLQEGTRMCRSLGDRFSQIQALVHLGDALEHTGDVAGAKQAYEDVLAAWGKAKPASASASEARARLASLGTAAK